LRAALAPLTVVSLDARKANLMWPFLRAVQAETSACERCSDLRLSYDIRTPGELRHAVRVARENLADGTLRDVTPRTLAEVGFAGLPENGPWPDLVECYFECTACGWRFRLAVDTYHGTDGNWEPYQPTGRGA